MTITAIPKVRTMNVATYTEPLSLSQIFIDMINGAALRIVDVKLKRLQDELDHPKMIKRPRRRLTQVRRQIEQLNTERDFIARTMSAQLS